MAETSKLQPHIVGVVGAGAMGAGIAEVAARHGHAVLLFDADPQGAPRAMASIEASFTKQVDRGRMTPDEASEALDRLGVAHSVEALKPAALVIEAVKEDLAVKRAVMTSLEDVVADETVLASNTSSLSITAIGAALRHPERFVGMHFFNPPTAMKLVEVVSGLATSSSVAQSVADTAAAWGKVPVFATSTPGFIVNRIARPFYAEALRLLEEKVATPHLIDDLLTDGGGFRMGPCALMDLIGHDVNYAVTCSVYDAYYQDPRFRPSLLQRELVDAGWLGRKTGRGFFEYGVINTPSAEADVPAGPGLSAVSVDGSAQLIDGVLVAQTDGRTASDRQRSEVGPVLLYDLMGPGATAVAYACSTGVTDDYSRRFEASLRAVGVRAVRLEDVPGLVVMRTVAMLVNEAFDVLHHGIADTTSIELAMVHGVNYPTGPLKWGADIGLSRVVDVIDHLNDAYRDPRYRTSRGLRSAANASDTIRSSPA